MAVSASENFSQEEVGFCHQAASLSILSYTLESFSKDWDHGLEHGPLSVPHLAVDFLPLDLALNAVQLAQHELEPIVV